MYINIDPIKNIWNKWSNQNIKGLIADSLLLFFGISNLLCFIFMPSTLLNLVTGVLNLAVLYWRYKAL